MKRYVILEQNIPYDWDDYYVWVSNYYDTEEKKVVENYFGHGTPDKLAPESMSVQEAINQGIPEDEIRLAIVNNLGPGAIEYSTQSRYNVPCTVKGSKKLNGELILVGFERNLNKWASARSYHGPVYDERFVVFEPSTNRLARVGTNQVTLNIDSKQVFWNGSKSESIWSLAHLIAYRQSYSACDSRNYHNGIGDIMNIGLIMTYGKCDIEMAVDPWEQKKEDKRKAKIKAKQDAARPDIERWANEKFPDKTPEEREAIVQRTLEKYYS